MTTYDPFSFGQVKLGDKTSRPPASPDDLLFADAGPKKVGKPAADASWELMNEDVDKLLPGAGALPAAIEFGTEILGESVLAAPQAPAAAPMRRPASVAPTAAKKGSDGASKLQLGPVRAAPTKEVRAKDAGGAAAARSTPATAPVPAVRGSAPIRARRGHPVAGIVVPFVLCAAGGTAASWFGIAQQNGVMAGIVGLLTLVSGAFAWLSLRP